MIKKNKLTADDSNDNIKIDNAFIMLSMIPTFRCDQENNINLDKNNSIDYFALNPSFDSLIQREMIKEENLSERTHYDNYNKQGYIFEEFIVNKVKSCLLFLICHPRLFFHLNKAQRNVINSIEDCRIAKEHIINSMTYVYYDSIFTVENDEIIDKLNGFRLIFTDRKDYLLIPLIVFKQEEIIVLKVKRSFNIFSFVQFIDNVMGLYQFFYSKKKILHLIFFYDKNESLSSDDMILIQSLLDEDIPEKKSTDIWNNCWDTAEDKYSSDEKKNFIISSFNHLRLLRKKNKVSIDIIHYDTLIFFIHLGKTQKQEIEDQKEKLISERKEFETERMKNDFEMAKLKNSSEINVNRKLFVLLLLFICIFVIDYLLTMSIRNR